MDQVVIMNTRSLDKTIWRAMARDRDQKERLLMEAGFIQGCSAIMTRIIINNVIILMTIQYI